MIPLFVIFIITIIFQFSIIKGQQEEIKHHKAMKEHWHESYKWAWDMFVKHTENEFKE
jgi:preprotein translocase subunit YajC